MKNKLHIRQELAYIEKQILSAKKTLRFNNTDALIICLETISSAALGLSNMVQENDDNE